jgi:UDP-N-acetylglucosamine--N-acetylmuramyl-(pentapeptide) pyrophosphoryl-undecaprenol N-acetylglucosamine transferase
VEAVYGESGVRCVVRAFFERMGEAWTAADLAVSRAGAGGVAEAWAYGVPTLFLPNPYHKDEHQRLNAMRLVEAGGAVVVRDRVDAGLNTEAVEALAGLMGDSEKREKMMARLRGLGPADGAERVAGGVREVLA